MRIGVDGVRIRPSGDLHRHRETKQPAATPGTAIVPVNEAPDGVERRYRTPRNVAAFITQLIAVSQHAPATRARRRLDPAAAAAIYRNMAAIGVPKRYKMRPY